MYMKNKPKKYQISEFTEMCVLYTRKNKHIIYKGSYYYCKALREMHGFSVLETNIVTKNFFDKVLTA